MCGICGFTNYRNDVLLREMLNKMFHRGPDEEGFYIENSFVSFGIRRLKVIDLITGSQPIFNEDRNIVVVCNGEIYNFVELKNKLQTKGHIFKTNTDVEVIVHLYEDFGLEFVKYLRGMFAFALWDKKNKTLILARDHFGIKPLHYLVVNNSLFFSSEISPLYLLPNMCFEVNKNALSYFFTFLYIPEPFTIIKQIKKLPAASLLVWHDGNFYINKYWKLQKTYEFEDLKEDFILEKIKELFYSSIKEQLISDVPLGIFLSGGLDSSLILSSVSKINTGKIKTFTVGFTKEYSSFNEINKAEIVSKHFDTQHTLEILTPEIEKIIFDILEKSGEPFGDSSIIPTYLISKSARKSITVALSGIGGDELFGGYPRYIGAYLAQKYIKIPLFLQKIFFSLVYNLKLTHQKRDVVNWIKRFFYVSSNLKEKYILWNSSVDFYERKQIFIDKEIRDINLEIFPQIRNYEDVFYFDLSTYLKDNLLFISDRASMANSLELRVPFLDVRLVEFLNRISLRKKIKNFTLKYYLRKILEIEGLPPVITKQKKQGFQIPLSKWVTEELQELIGDYLSPHRIKREGLINYKYLQEILNQHKSKKRDFSDLLFAILVWEMWNEKFAILASGQNNKSIEITSKLKVLLINLGGLGDIVMMSPILKALHNKYHAIEVTLLTIPRSKEIAKNFSYIYKIYTLPIKYKMFNLSNMIEIIKVLKDLKRTKFDAVINLRTVDSLLGMFKILLIKKFINSDTFIGYGKKFAKKIFNFFFEEDRYRGLTEVEITYKLLTILGIRGVPDYIFYPLNNEFKDWADNYIKEKTSNKKHIFLVGFCPGAFRPSRRWPLEYWRQLAEVIVKSYKDTVIFIFGNNQEKKLVRTISSGLPSIVVTNEDLDNFNKVAAVLRKMDVVVSNDTGLMHLAAALGSKVICLFGPGDVVKYTPYVEKENLYILRKESVNCKRPCYRYNCKDLKCLKDISPIEVFEIISKIISNRVCKKNV
ncbi:MAG: asparagine synthase (glutamine-hydrolyzing) [Endomicrobia bacterium]|nr:asparagine synthase (glutamine-hydrolyzing) [Endomicrobiia bacterium]